MQITDKNELLRLVSQEDVRVELKCTKRKLEEKNERIGMLDLGNEKVWSAVIAIRKGIHHPAVLVRYYASPGRGMFNFLGSKHHNWYLAENGEYIQEPDKFIAEYSHEVDWFAVFGCRYEYLGHERNPQKFDGAFEMREFLEILGVRGESKAARDVSSAPTAYFDSAAILINKAVENLGSLGREKCTFEEVIIEARRLAESQRMVWGNELEQACRAALNRFEG